MTLGPDGLVWHGGGAERLAAQVTGLWLEAELVRGGYGLVQLGGGGVGADGVVLAERSFRLVRDGGSGRLLCGKAGS